MSDLVKLYNPANAASLTPEQIEGLQKLTSTEIKELATAYPNRIFNRSYLLIKNTKDRIPIDKQLASLSTFENLYNLITKNNFTGYVAVGFKGHPQQRITNVKPKKSQVIDLSETELLTLPGFKTANTVEPPSEVQVTKVKKTRKTK